MAGKRKRHSPEFKAKVALEALNGLKTVHELAREYEVHHPTQIAQWKRQPRDHAGDVFALSAQCEASGQEAELAQAYEQIGRLNVELAWLKKSGVNSTVPRPGKASVD